MQVQRYYEPRHMSKPLQCFVCVFEDGFARLLQNLERLSGNLKWWRMHKITVKEFVKKRSPESILYLFQAAKKVSASNLSSGESFSASRALIEIWRSRKKNFPLSKFESPPLFTHMFPNFFHTVAVKIYCLWKTLSFDICRLPLFPIFVTAYIFCIYAFV